ncbi:MAG: ferric reductase-like transmembrane domain-containing protein [Sutterellaceae bacterium]|nr:ferric reductase-like transmembrane domain-containing protein [Sutterellaceae bacterium]MDD7441376.1 ferric reductase-like transmembrane domain-containing protein [Sutterellaceae bacterium]MDY2867478.1 ferric reductase-like transmembrane domain-containing protein [Mesosutterella sp.]
MLRLNLIVFGFALAAYVLQVLCFPFPLTTRDVLHQMFVVTGVAAWILMAEAMVIAARPAWLERIAGEPLDRLMAAHKKIGWAMVAFLALHVAAPWIRDLFPLIQVPMMEEHHITGFWQGVWTYLHPLGGLTAILITIYGATVIYRDALRGMRKIAWPRWEKAHMMWAWIFLGLALHAVRSLKETELFMPLGWITVASTVIGCWATVRILRGRKGSPIRSGGTVEKAAGDGDVLFLTVRTAKAKEIRAGEFVYLSLPGDREDSHPFTVAGSDPERETLFFWIKEAGEWTKALGRSKPGDTLFIEGPFGTFAPDFPIEGNEAWVAGGAGIAPFIGWLEELKEARKAGKSAPQVTLWWSVRHRAEGGLPFVTALANEAGAKLVVHETGDRHVHLPPEEVLQGNPDRIAVCGKPGLTRSLRAAWKGGARSFRSEAY